MENKELLIEGIANLEKLNKINPATSKLGGEVIYNFVCIGIETLITAVLMGHDCLIDHSAIFRMLKELEKYETVDPEWLDCARYMNRFQSYCSLEPIPAKIPTNEDLKRMIDFGTSVHFYGVGKLEKVNKELELV